MFDTSSIAGEACHRYTCRLDLPIVQGASIIVATYVQEPKRPNNIGEYVSLSKYLRKLAKEFSSPAPSSRQCLAAPVVDRRASEKHARVDKAEPRELEEKALMFIRNTSSGQALMDLGHFDGYSGHEDWEWRSAALQRLLQQRQGRTLR